MQTRSLEKCSTDAAAPNVAQAPEEVPEPAR